MIIRDMKVLYRGQEHQVKIKVAGEAELECLSALENVFLKPGNDTILEWKKLKIKGNPNGKTNNH